MVKYPLGNQAVLPYNSIITTIDEVVGSNRQAGDGRRGWADGY